MTRAYSSDLRERVVGAVAGVPVGTRGFQDIRGKRQQRYQMGPAVAV